MIHLTFKFKQPKIFNLSCQKDFDNLIRFTQYDKYPFLTKWLLSIGFLWKKEEILDHTDEVIFVIFKHRIFKEKIIVTDNE